MCVCVCVCVQDLDDPLIKCVCVCVQDLDDPLSGLYAFRGALDERTAVLEGLLVDLETKPATYVPDTVSLTSIGREVYCLSGLDVELCLMTL